MRNPALLYPMFALAAWTFFVLVLIPIARTRSARRREIVIDDFKYGESPAVLWAFVVLRVVHSLIHLSYNRVVHRLAAFTASNVALVGLWLAAGLHLAAAAP